MNNVFIGIGSNLGDKEGNIRKAVDFLKEKCNVIKVSSLYKAEPIDYKDQDMFLNCVIHIKTDFSAKDLLVFLHSIENRLGRERNIVNGPRTIDLDILFYDALVLNDTNLIIPHPRLHERKFVLVPLVEITPDFMHPIFRKSVTELLSELDGEGLVELYKKY